MKRYGFLFERAFSVENLYAAYRDAIRTKRKSPKVFEFERNLSSNIRSIYADLWSGCYQVSKYNVFNVYEPKQRVIYAPKFRDVVVQHAIYRIIYDIFDRTFIDQSFGCRKGKGAHKASDYAQRALRKTPGKFLLQLDIEKFFYSLDHNVLRAQIERRIKDPRLNGVIEQFIWYPTEGVGVPIGNLLSQLFALIYLNPLDHFIKRGLKAKTYCRYVDDFILFGLDRGQAYKYREKIREFLDAELKLKLSRWRIARTEKGVNFVGYRTWAGRRFIRKHSLYKFRRKARAGKLKSVVSLLAHASKTSSLTHMKKYLKECHYDIYLQLPKVYR